MTLVVVLVACLAAGAALAWPARPTGLPGHGGPGSASPAGTTAGSDDAPGGAPRHAVARRASADGGSAADRSAADGGQGRAALRGAAGQVLRRRWGRSGARASAGRAGTIEEVQLLDGLAAALEAGLPTEHAVQVALEHAVPGRDAGPWAALAREARAGHPLGPAWQRLARRTGSQTAASVARAWTVATATGAPVAAAVRTSAHAARERRRLERVVETATAGARATATVLGLLPLAGVGLAALVGVGPSALYGHPLAIISAGLGAVLLLSGHLVVRRMVDQVLRGVW